MFRPNPDGAIAVIRRSSVPSTVAWITLCPSSIDKLIPSALVRAYLGPEHIHLGSAEKSGHELVPRAGV